MTTMVSTLLRSSRGYLLEVGCALLAAAALGGCARVINGTVQAVEHDVVPAKPIPVADLLIEPTRFPGRYPAAVLAPNDVDRVVREIDGVPTGSVVTPPECAPPPVAQDTVAVQGTDPDTGATLVVTVSRPAPSLSARVDQLAGCSSFTSAAGGDIGGVSEVTVDLPPAPPVDADGTYAVDQTVTSESSDGSDGGKTRTLTLVALVDDVRVTTSWQQQQSSVTEPDTQSLDTLFTDAVLKVRSVIPR